MTLRRLAPLLLLPLFAATPAWAQDAAAPAEHARIAAERKTVEERHEKERAGCYQKFAVQDCLTESRRRKRSDIDALNRQEATLNDAERKRRGDAQLQRLDDKKPPTEAEAAASRERALASQRGREERAADQAARREAEAAQTERNRRAFESKQRAHAEEQAKAQAQRAQEQAERASYEAKRQAAEKERADLDARNAKRTKPRAAPLPPPPP